MNLNYKNLFDNDDENIMIHIFEVNTLSYYRNKKKEFDFSNNLAGLTWKYQLKILIKSNGDEKLTKYQIK